MSFIIVSVSKKCMVTPLRNIAHSIFNVVNNSSSYTKFPINKTFKPKNLQPYMCGWRFFGFFIYLISTFLMFQISSAYCIIVRSLEKIPAFAIFIRHIFAQRVSSW